MKIYIYTFVFAASLLIFSSSLGLLVTTFGSPNISIKMSLNRNSIKYWLFDLAVIASIATSLSSFLSSTPTQEDHDDNTKSASIPTKNVPSIFSNMNFYFPTCLTSECNVNLCRESEMVFDEVFHIGEFVEINLPNMNFRTFFVSNGQIRSYSIEFGQDEHGSSCVKLIKYNVMSGINGTLLEDVHPYSLSLTREYTMGTKGMCHFEQLGRMLPCVVLEYFPDECNDMGGCFLVRYNDGGEMKTGKLPLSHIQRLVSL